ncbi:MAG: 3-dehydroquinate synthase, partial [Kiritimatiellae bacterium]|nr:3-dehydroquinate synthase [Kiritimatiellia bacterium]
PVCAGSHFVAGNGGQLGGCKTGINLPQGKNLIGAFHQPSAVFADLETLATLPEREYRSGLAEVIKYGIIEDAWFFTALENQAEALKQRDMETLARVVSRCCEIKSEVVRFDEKECGVRAILNFGHTFGHALETCSGYGKLLHGEAISIGMVYAAHLSHEVSDLSAQDLERIEWLLIRMGLPVKAPPLDWKELYAVMQKDKKNQRRDPLFVLAPRIGNVVHGVEVPQAIMRRTWNAILDQPENQEEAQAEPSAGRRRRADG